MTSDENQDETRIKDDGSPTVPEAVIQAEKPGFVNRFFSFLFNPQTRLGRASRSIVRAAALFVGVFSLGLLAAYFLLFRPANQALDSTRADLNVLQTQQADTKTKLDLANKSLDDLQVRLDETQQNLDTLQVRTQLLNVLDHVQEARLALAGLNGTTSANNELAAASNRLKEALPTLTKKNPEAARSIPARLDLAISEVSRSDTTTAKADLNILVESIRKLDTDLSK
jgi:hypothetical protein